MATVPPARIDRIETFVDEWLHEADVPGASVVLFDADGEVFAEGFGARDLETNAPATPDTIYGIGSISKPVTSVAIAQLVESDALMLDDPVDEYVDHFTDAPGDPITVADLLSHTSGMPANTIGVLDQHLDGRPAGVADEADRERFVRAGSHLRDTETDRFMYYNTGYAVLGRVVEAVDGRDYADYVHDEVLAPLGMDRATYDRETFEADDDAMTGYAPGEDGPEATPFPFDDLIQPSGGLLASVRELSRFVRAAMNGGTLEGARLCGAETLERFQRRRAVRQTYLDGREEAYGYGWMRHPLWDDVALGHGGSIVVSTAYGGYLRDAGLGVAIACNTTADPHPMEVGLAVLALATGREPTAVPAYAIEEKCEPVTGTYETFRGGMSVTVERMGGGVGLEFESVEGEYSLPAFPESLDPDVFDFYAVAGDGGRVPVAFHPERDPADLFFRRHRFRRVESGS